MKDQDKTKEQLLEELAKMRQRIVELERSEIERSKAEKELKESEEKFSKTFISSPNPMAITRVSDSCLVDINQSFIDTLGYTLKELIGHRAVDIGMWVQPEERGRITKGLQKQKRLHNNEIQLRTKSGEILTMLVSAENIILNDEPHLLTIASNITERKKDEEALRASGERLRLATNQIPAVLWTTDTDLKFTSSTGAGLNALGLKADQVIGMTLFEYLQTDDPENLAIKAYSQAIKGNITNYEFEWEGRVFDSHVRPLQNKEGSIIGTIGFALDITERKQAEMSLRNEKEFTETALNAQQDTFFLFEPATGRAIRWNRVFNDITGYTDEEISRMPAPNSYYSPEDLKLAANFIENVLETGVGNIELELICKDGRKVPTEYNVAVIKDEAGSPKYIISIGRDTTERKKLEEEQQKSHKLESIGILAGGIAHDFNNLLAIILSNVYMVKMKVDHKSNVYGNITEIEKAMQRATDLTHQLLTFSKGGAPVKKTASIIEIIEESAEFVLRGSNVKCEYNTSENLRSVEVDQGQMNQVIHNLILNADQSMPEGGTIRIYAENFDLSSGTGLPLKEGRYIKVTIQDEGIGISEEHLQKLFDPYFTTKEMGRGLGLSVTYSIIKQHDGHISAESELGVGTTFTIYLPASEKQVEEINVAADALGAGEGKILLMDDEEMLRKGLGEFLMMTGYKVDYAKDGEEAIDLYEKAIKASEPFDVVILDLTIPGGMGGKEAIKKLLEIDPDVKAIVSSGYSNDPVMANFREYGFTAVYNKATKPKEILNVLNRVVDG